MAIKDCASLTEAELEVILNDFPDFDLRIIEEYREDSVCMYGRDIPVSECYRLI